MLPSGGGVIESTMLERIQVRSSFFCIEEESCVYKILIN